MASSFSLLTTVDATLATRAARGQTRGTWLPEVKRRTIWCTVLVVARLIGLVLPGTMIGGELRAQIPAETTPERPLSCKLGVVLSGGGARGIAHLGVLEVLEEHGVRPDCIVGASMGAVIGSSGSGRAYALGSPRMACAPRAAYSATQWRIAC